MVDPIAEEVTEGWNTYVAEPVAEIWNTYVAEPAAEAWNTYVAEPFEENIAKPTADFLNTVSNTDIYEDVLLPTGKAIRDGLSTLDLTYSTGLNLSGTLGHLNFNIQGGVSIDTKGNVVAQWTPAFGGSSAQKGVSASIYETVTNAPSVDNLNGLGTQMGVSAAFPIYGVPAMVGVDANSIPDLKTGEVYQGITTYEGVGTKGVDVHFTTGYTSPIGDIKFNIFEELNSICKRIFGR